MDFWPLLCSKGIKEHSAVYGTASKSTTRTGVTEKATKRYQDMARGSDVKIEIRLISPQQTYTSNDVIHGTATLQSSTELQFGDIRIELIGTSRALIERWTATPACLPYTEVAHDFLRLSQPGIESKYPADRTLRADKRYTFGFTFVVPKQLPEGVCKHAISDASVRDAHAHLPSSLGKCTVQGRDGAVDDMAHPKASISYGISVAVTHQDRLADSKLLAHACRRLRMVPTVPEWSGPEVVRMLKDHHEGSHCLRKEEAVRGGILKRRLGSMIAEAEVPNSVRLPATVNLTDRCRATTMATVKLRFERASGTNNAPPQLDKVTSKLKVRTDISSRPCHDFPQHAEVLFDAQKSRRGDSIDLASRALSGVLWRTENAVSPCIRDVGSEQEGWSPNSPNTGSAFVTEVIVPVSLPNNKTFVPTFHSCYISRMYALDICVSYSTGGASGCVNLRLPLQVTAGSTDEQSTPMEHDAWILPTYEEPVLKVTS